MGDFPAIRTFVYTDGLNLYHRALQDTPYRWLNIGELLLLPQHEVTAIHYFTSIVSARPNDPSATERQAAYLRALETVPGLTIHRGYFRNQTKAQASSAPAAGRPAHGRSV